MGWEEQQTTNQIVRRFDNIQYSNMADWYKASLVNTDVDDVALAESQPVVPNEEDPFFSFHSRRSVLVCRHAAVASSQPLATAIGYDILKQGGNAADAAVAVAAALAVTEPCSTGLGGDMFCLYYQNKYNNNNKNVTETEKEPSTGNNKPIPEQQQPYHGISCINGSGRSPKLLTLKKIQESFPSNNNNISGSINVEAFRDSALAITVPGAAAGWEDLWLRHGSGSARTSNDKKNFKSFTFAELLEPAARLAEHGFPVAPVTSYHWRAGMPQIQKWIHNQNYDDDSETKCKKLPMTCPNGLPPRPGDIVVNADLARVLRLLGQHGATQGFYGAAPGHAMVDAALKHGGCLHWHDDLMAHRSEFPEPISVEYRGCRLWQVPPNGQGIASLIALEGLRHLRQAQMIPENLVPGSTVAYHAMIEMMRLGLADLRAYVADPAAVGTTPSPAMTAPPTVEFLLDSERIRHRATTLFDPKRATIQGAPDASSCTVSFQVVDAQGNAVSFVNSNFQGFGTGIVPDGCGFTLQNRGFGFQLVEPEAHSNAVGPQKRPCHTIIPGLLTHADTGELYATISNMGGNMQPQGHLQLTIAMLDGNLDPQSAIDLPRFCIADGTQNGTVFLEEGIDDVVIEELRDLGHNIKCGVQGHERSIFGRAQIIKRDRVTGVIWAGSDGRADGSAMGF